jgi:hypothetical protein
LIPRHEWPWRIVMSVGLFSWWCVVGFIVLALGGASVAK